MKKILPILILLLFSCGSRKADSQKEVIKETTTEQSTTEIKGSTNSELSEKTLLDIFEIFNAIPAI